MFYACLMQNVEDGDHALIFMPRKRDLETPSSFGHNCLPNGAGSIFEKIVTGHITEYLNNSGLMSRTVWFQAGRSNAEAITRVILLHLMTTQGRLSLTLFLYVVNAFISLSWCCIRQALITHRMSECPRRVISVYVRSGTILVNNVHARSATLRKTSRGISQGSVLGILLWYLGFNVTRRCPMRRRSFVMRMTLLYSQR